MRDIRVAAVQFEARDGDKDYNLSVIQTLTRQAVEQRAELVCFHECSIPGYTFLENLTRPQLEAIAEPVPHGPSVQALRDIAAATGATIAAGLLEHDGDQLFNCHVVVNGQGLLAKHRKIHEFISDHISCGDRHTVFEACGARIGILTCYDNNLPENPRLTAMMGAEIILMPHVTGCLPSPMPGRGVVDPEVWHNRERDPVRCRQEFDGPKGRGWILRWLPARAWENGVYAIYSNPIGIEGGTVKPGGSMILDPYGEVLAECRTLGDEVVVASLVPEKLTLASGASYIRARRPDLYARMVEPNPSLSPHKRPEVYWKTIRKD
ncbi:MAG TPA: nitrilase-related carbon-nitrogen hydrolase [Bryobacteraceae bacterium]|nr:nitrilase-related carbon-nitrogen hydrolase [Bryobacteraceae bacterium]